MTFSGWYADCVGELDPPRWRPTFVDTRGFESWLNDHFSTEQECIDFIDREIVGAVRLVTLDDEFATVVPSPVEEAEPA